MENAILHIKNMVCPRCISTVSRVLTQAGLPVAMVNLGEAHVAMPPAKLDFDALNKALQQEGFELLYDREKQLTEKIKNLLIDYLQHSQTQYQPLTTSAFLADQLNLPYAQLSKVFSRHQHTTLEKYFIRLKIEKVKELLSYHQLTLSEIAHQLKYSSVQHLSNQFKKVTGMSVSEFKSNAAAARTSLDALL